VFGGVPCCVWFGGIEARVGILISRSCVRGILAGISYRGVGTTVVLGGESATVGLRTRAGER